tara:strand:- start:28348 stop:29043 length:696 start_codon:yes stop_codon:yes gene_type:complete
MKKIFTIFALAALTFTASNAQELKIGAKAGVNLSSLGGDKVPGIDTKGKIGLHLGGVGVYMFSDKFGAQAELLYSSFGGKQEFNFSEEGFTDISEETTKLNYLSLPLMGKYYVTESLSFEAGPRIGFLLSANSEFEDTFTFDGETETESGEVDISKGINGLDLGFNIGASYELESGLFFSLRYTLGLSNIYDSGSVFADIDEDGDIIDGIGTFSQQNNAFQISVGYFFLND